MKALIAIASLALIVFACDQQRSDGNMVQIVDVRSVSEVPPAPQPKAGDIYVERTLFLGQGYSIGFYPEVDGQLTEYSAFLASDEDFDEAWYEWIGETEVSVRLVNSDNKNEVQFIVYAEGNKTGIRY